MSINKYAKSAKVLWNIVTQFKGNDAIEKIEKEVGASKSESKQLFEFIYQLSKKVKDFDAFEVLFLAEKKVFKTLSAKEQKSLVGGKSNGGAMNTVCSPLQTSKSSSNTYCKG